MFNCTKYYNFIDILFKFYLINVYLYKLPIHLLSNIFNYVLIILKHQFFTFIQYQFHAYLNKCKKNIIKQHNSIDSIDLILR